MVSKLSILKTYYHLPLEDQFSFTYEDEHYYLTNKPFPLYYQKYISLLQINPFKTLIIFTNKKTLKDTSFIKYKAFL